MRETVEPLIAGWESFYVIVGSSGAALTGLQFVVMTLVSERRRGGPAEIDAFATPTVVHFTMALLVSAVLSAPWTGARGPSALLSLFGVGGVVYTAIVTRRARRATQYTPVMEDWIWHVALPFLAYATLAVAAAFLTRDEVPALFAVAAVSLLLLSIGIHNAWDTVTYLTLQSNEDAAAAKPAAPTAAPAQPPARQPVPLQEAQTPVELL